MQAKFRYGSPITGAGAYSSVAFIARSQNYLRDEYVLQASFREGANIVLGLFKQVNGKNTRIVTDVSVPVASLVNTEYMLKAEVTGKNPTTLRIKVWQASNPEPSGWNHSATDSEPLLQSEGENAIKFYSTNISSSSYPLMWRLDNLLIRSLSPSLPYPTPTDLPDYRVNYGVKVREVSPLIFGGTHSPSVSHVDAWNKLSDVGVSMVRLDLSINNFFTGLPSFPGGVTLSDWQNNVNNIRDPSTWNSSHLADLRARLQMAKDRGMKTIIIVDYAPTWLTYSGTIFGVPQDMAIYKDIVKKSFDLVDDLTDYAEIWNEPSLYTDSLVGYTSGKFFDLRGSPYDPGQAVHAYKELFKHSAAGVREVNSSIPIIAVAAHSPDQSQFLDTLLADPVTGSLVDWVSYHNYTTEEPSYRDRGVTPTPGFHSVKIARNRSDIRIGITEWNASSDGNNTSEKRHTEKEAISYTGRKLSQFLKSKIDFANYYALLPYTGQGSQSFYRWVNNEAVLLPQARTWRLLSVQLGLGKKEGMFVVESLPNTEMPILSAIKLTNQPELLGVTDDKGFYAVALTNDSEVVVEKPVALQGLPRYSSIQINFYEASETNTAESPVKSLSVKPGESFPEVTASAGESGVVTINFTAPARSVVAAVISLSPEGSYLPDQPAQDEKGQRPANCPENFRYCSHLGPHALSNGTGFVSGSEETESVQVFIPRSATPHDLHVLFSRVHPWELSLNTMESIPLPWSQGLNTAGEIYNIQVVSAFNGYPIVEFAEPGIVMIPFDRSVLAERKISADRLRIARYVHSQKRWRPLPGKPVINWQNNTVAMVSSEYGYFAVVYR
ncbi:MAG: cellulase family glycosylhydrolase [Patescibacteria group bacterium]|nr:cellulase family glycosylhydrolase [Patescibacteria group bacterium]